jgi:hypothetical protein
MLTRKPLLAKLSGLLPITQCESNTALGRRGTELEEPTIGKLRTPGLPKLSGVLLVNSKNAFMARGKAQARSYQNLCMPHAVMWIPIGIKNYLKGGTAQARTPPHAVMWIPIWIKRWYSTSTQGEHGNRVKEYHTSKLDKNIARQNIIARLKSGRPSRPSNTKSFQVWQKFPFLEKLMQRSCAHVQ